MNVDFKNVPCINILFYFSTCNRCNAKAAACIGTGYLLLHLNRKVARYIRSSLLCRHHIFHSPAMRQKKQLRQLIHEEEDDMAEWLKSNPCLYNKKLEDYRKTDMKQRLWEDKAAEFPNVDVACLLGWYKSIRTRFGKLSKIPSGSGAQEVTNRDASIFTKFAFLKTHITRQWGTQLTGVSIINLLNLNNLFIFHIHIVLLYYFHFV